MNFRKFAADYLFTGLHLLRDMVLVSNDDGVVQDIIPEADAGNEVQRFKGVLSPGLINSHCHLELSHLKDVIPPHTGLIEFLVSVVQKRGFERELILHAIKNAEQEMYNNGIVAVGDICNTADAVEVKRSSRIRWHNFVEVLSFTDLAADDRLTHYRSILDQHHTLPGQKNRSVLTPHAPYTISPKTFKLLNQFTANQVISIHNQEHPAENELYKMGGGEYLKLFSIFGMDRSPFPVTGKNSIQSYLPYFTNGQTIFLVHNTYMSVDDIAFAHEYAFSKGIKLVYCLCVNANRYIENTTPPIELFVNNNCHIVLGTDSYSSNWQLDIAKEIETVLNTSFFKSMPYYQAFESVMQWATINGAQALQMDDELGSFEKGKKPGIVLIENLEERNLVSSRIL